MKHPIGLATLALLMLPVVCRGQGVITFVIGGKLPASCPTGSTIGLGDGGPAVCADINDVRDRVVSPPMTRRAVKVHPPCVEVVPAPFRHYLL